MKMVLLCFGFIGPGMAFKALSPSRYSLASFLLGELLFVCLYPAYVMWQVSLVDMMSLLPLAVLVAVAMRPLFVFGYRRWNRAMRPAREWLCIRVAGGTWPVVIAAPMGVLVAAVIIGRFNPDVAAMMPYLVVEEVYARINPVQFQVACILSGAVGGLLLITHKLLKMEKEAEAAQKWRESATLEP